MYWSVLALCRELVWIPHLGLHICIQKSSTRLGLVSLSFKAILGRSQGLLICVDVEGVAWEVMWKIGLSFKEVSYIYWGLVFPKKTIGWLQSIISKCSGFVSVIYPVNNSLREPSESSNSLQSSSTLYSTSQLVPLAIGHFLSPHTLFTTLVHLL